MLFGGRKNRYPAVISIFTSILMTVISLVPFLFNVPGLKLSIYAASLIYCLVFGSYKINKSIYKY